MAWRGVVQLVHTHCMAWGGLVQLVHTHCTTWRGVVQLVHTHSLAQAQALIGSGTWLMCICEVCACVSVHVLV